MRLIYVNLFFVSLSLLAGCGGGDSFNRQAVKGTISIDGKLIPYGNIEFAPAENQPTTLSLEIREGKFQADRKQGLSPGEYIIRVQGFDGPLPPPGDEPGTYLGPVPKVIVGEQHNSRSTRKVVVKADEENDFKIELSSKSS